MIEITVKFKAHDDIFKLVTPEERASLENGEWRIVALGMDSEKHGIGHLLLRKDDAPLYNDHYAALSRLARGLENELTLLSAHAKKEGRM